MLKFFTKIQEDVYRLKEDFMGSGGKENYSNAEELRIYYL